MLAIVRVFISVMAKVRATSLDKKPCLDRLFLTKSFDFGGEDYRYFHWVAGSNPAVPQGIVAQLVEQMTKILYSLIPRS